MNKFIRQPHATANLASRRLKAKKIEILLGLKPSNEFLNFLEIGCGSGGISHYFAKHPELNCVVTAVDVHDSRQVHEGYGFQNVKDVFLPFEDKCFDVVISNHVIEHVGASKAQNIHLKEIYRVLKNDGVAYLAVPNRWMLTEPHYGVKFLSWLPRAWRSIYLRWSRKGKFYDCEPLQLHEIEEMLKKSDFFYQNKSVEGWRVTFDLEHSNQWSDKLLKIIPDVLLSPMKPIIPTLIFKLQKSPLQENN